MKKNIIKQLAEITSNTYSEMKELIDNDNYVIYSDSEADDKAKEYILDSVWAFQSSFLSAHLKKGIDSEVIDCIQANGKCEDNNEAIISLIDDIDHFVNDAISCDGRGRFMSSYDGEEIELDDDNYAYRID